MSAQRSKIRNIGVAAHIDAGKTTTTERILFYTGKTHRMGDVDQGTTTTDFDGEEQKRGITIYSAAVSCPWKGHTLNLIDTPGHVDFTAEVERSLRVLDGVIAVFDAREGVEPQSETVWRQADKYSVPRICFINKMDRLGADFERSVESLGARLGAKPLVIQLPIGASDSFNGLIDLIEMKAVYYTAQKLGSTFETREIPQDLAEEASRHRGILLETLSETSDKVMESYLSGEAVDAKVIHQAIREATLSHGWTPVLCGSALRYIGVQRLLDAVCEYLPSPLDSPPVIAMDGRQDDKTVELACDLDGPLAALVFKIVAEKPVDLYYLRIYSGRLRPNMRLLNSVTGDKENISRIYQMFAKRRDQLDEAVAGDIVAVIGPKKSLTGHTLCDQRKPVILESISFPETVISVSVEPRSAKDRDKLFEALAALERQDPTINVTTNPETGQTLIAGMGELHVEVVVQRLRTEVGVEVSVGKPRVAYRETVTQAAEGVGRFDRQIGGRRHAAVVRVSIEPREHASGRANFEVVGQPSEEVLSAEYVEAIETGIADGARSGVLGGYPVIDWKVTIIEGREEGGDGTVVAFESAARMAFETTMNAASPVLLEPIMEVEVVTAEAYFGAIMGDLTSRHAEVKDTLLRGSDRIIFARAPLSQMTGYVTRLRSLSQGRATSSMSPSHYAPVPESEMKRLVG